MKADPRVSVPAMNRATQSTVTLLAFALLVANPVSAQEPAAQAPTEANVNASIVTTAPNQGASSRDIWFQQDLAAAEARSHRSRNALIWTSAVFGVGAILVGVGASQCQTITTINNYDDLVVQQRRRCPSSPRRHPRRPGRDWHDHLGHHSRGREQAEARHQARHAAGKLRPSSTMGHSLRRPRVLGGAARSAEPSLAARQCESARLGAREPRRSRWRTRGRR